MLSRPAAPATCVAFVGDGRDAVPLPFAGLTGCTEEEAPLPPHGPDPVCLRPRRGRTCPPHRAGGIREGPLAVNIGPTLMYTGLLAALLRGRIVRDHESEAESGDCAPLTRYTVLACTLWVLWRALRTTGAWPDAEGGRRKGSG